MGSICEISGIYQVDGFGGIAGRVGAKISREFPRFSTELTFLSSLVRIQFTALSVHRLPRDSILVCTKPHSCTQSRNRTDTLPYTGGYIFILLCYSVE